MAEKVFDKKPAAPSGGGDNGWILWVILVGAVLWFLGGGANGIITARDTGDTATATPSSGKSESSVTTSKSSQSSIRERSTRKTQSIEPNKSIYAGKVDLKLGKSAAKGGVGLEREYVVLSASSRNDEPITITGWMLDNGKDKKTYLVGGQMTAGISTVLAIPKGTFYLATPVKSLEGPVILKPGEKAYIITGNPPQLDDYAGKYSIDSSFKINKCSGYLAKMTRSFPFTPSLSTTNCPKYSEELNVESVPDSCLSFVKRYGSSCQTPEITHDREDGLLMDGRKVPLVCRNIIVPIFNYSACLERHKLDTDFYGKRWYVYLRRHTIPLWSADRATITLYDSLGKLVDTYAY